LRERGRFDRHEQTDGQAHHEDGSFARQSSVPAKSFDGRRGSFARPDIANPYRFIEASISKSYPSRLIRPWPRRIYAAPMQSLTASPRIPTRLSEILGPKLAPSRADTAETIGTSLA
jgi:hypothetical protein